jgi:hypothetical protein
MIGSSASRRHTRRRKPLGAAVLPLAGAHARVAPMYENAGEFCEPTADSMVWCLLRRLGWRAARVTAPHSALPVTL